MAASESAAVSKGFDGWQNYYFDPEYDDEDTEEDEAEEDYYFEPTDDDWEHYKDVNEWVIYKPNIWQRFRFWLSWQWHYKLWNACPDCHRPQWWGNHNGCIPF